MIVLENENTRAARNPQELRRGRNAVADRGNQSDVARIGIDQPRGRMTGALVLGIGKGGIEHPRRRLAAHRRAGGLLGSERQGAVGGRIQITDGARHFEEAALWEASMGGSSLIRGVYNAFEPGM